MPFGFPLFGAKEPPKKNALKLSEVHTYLQGFVQRAFQAVSDINARNEAAPANDATDSIRQLLSKTQSLLRKISQILEKVQGPSWYSVIPASYGQSLIEAAYEMLGLCHPFIFEIYRDLYNQGLLAPEEICKIHSIDASLTTLETSCNTLLKLGLQGKEPFNFEVDSMLLQDLVASHKSAYHSAMRKQFAASPAYIHFHKEFSLLFEEFKSKFENLEIDYTALSQFNFIVKATLKSAFEQIDTVLDALPNFKKIPSELTESEQHRWGAFSWTQHAMTSFRRSMRASFRRSSSQYSKHSFKCAGTQPTEEDIPLASAAEEASQGEQHGDKFRPSINMS